MHLNKNIFIIGYYLQNHHARSLLYNKCAQNVVYCICYFTKCCILYLLFHKMLYIVFVISQNAVYCICYFTKCCILYMLFHKMLYIVYVISQNVVNCISQNVVYCVYVTFSVISVDTDVEYELQGLGYAHDVVLHARI